MKKTNEKTIIKMDRRDLLKYSMFSGTAMFLANFDELAHANVCEYVNSKVLNSSDKLEVTPTDELLYWIDGPFASAFDIAGGLTKAKMAVHLTIQQTLDKYVEAVLLTDSDHRILAGQGFLPTHAMTNGMVPYVVFDNLDLDATKTYFINYLVREGGNNMKVIRFKLAGQFLRQSRLDYAHLSDAAKGQVPTQIVSDIKASNHAFKGKPELGFGYFTTPYQHFAGQPTHNVRAKLKNITNTGNFTFHIGKMHGDANADHYMRYFLVLDPVGRVLGGLKRVFGGSDKTDAFHAVTNTMQGFTNDASALNIKIGDCPYVQIITEDKQDAIARLTFRLR